MRKLTVENTKDLLGVSGIYIIKINDKHYVGSSTSIGHRLKHHLWALTSKKHHNRTMQNLFNKYGQKETIFYKLEDCMPDILIEREKYHIKNLKPYMNHVLDPQKIIRDDIYKKRLSDGMKKAYSEGLRPHNDKPIHQYSLSGYYIGSFNTATAAAKAFLKKDPAAICACARGESYTTYGYRWSYVKVDLLKSFKKKYKLQAVLQLDINENFIKEWSSITEAEDALKIKNISRACNNYKKAGGYLWRYKS